eukprot:364231-Chlamydomonas_euryale.AAC.7
MGDEHVNSFRAAHPRQCDIKLPMGKQGTGRCNPTLENVCPWLLLMVIAKAGRTGNCKRHCWTDAVPLWAVPKFRPGPGGLNAACEAQYLQMGLLEMCGRAAHAPDTVGHRGDEVRAEGWRWKGGCELACCVRSE